MVRTVMKACMYLNEPFDPMAGKRWLAGPGLIHLRAALKALPHLPIMGLQGIGRSR